MQKKAIFLTNVASFPQVSCATDTYELRDGCSMNPSRGQVMVQLVLNFSWSSLFLPSTLNFRPNLHQKIIFVRISFCNQQKLELKTTNFGIKITIKIGTGSRINPERSVCAPVFLILCRLGAVLLVGFYSFVAPVGPSDPWRETIRMRR